MEEFVTKTMEIKPTNQLWLRNVDDLASQRRETQDLFDSLKSSHPRITFTMKAEQEIQLPLLDMMV